MEEIRTALIIVTIIATPPVLYVYGLGFRSIVRFVKSWLKKRDVIGERLERYTQEGERWYRVGLLQRDL